MSIMNVSTLRKNLFSTIDDVINYDEPVTVNTKTGNAVIISEEEYNALKESLYLSSIPGFVKKVKSGEKEDVKKMSTYNPNEEW